MKPLSILILVGIACECAEKARPAGQRGDHFEGGFFGQDDYVPCGPPACPIILPSIHP